MQFLNHLDINENQTKKQKLYLATASGYTPTGGEGNLIYDTSDDLLKYWDGSQWITLMNSTGGATYTIQTHVAGGYANQVGFRLLGSNGTVDEIRFIGTSQEIEIGQQASPDGIKIGLPDDVVITNNLTVGNNTVITGNLTVNGTTTTVNSNTVSVGDNIIELNSDLGAGVAPSQDAGILINRGSSTDVQLRYNETADKWEFTNDGTNFCFIPCMTTGVTVLAYVKIYDDAGQSTSAANSSDNLHIEGGTCLVSVADSSGSMDKITINHATLGTGTTVHETYDIDTGGTTNLTFGGTFRASLAYFDTCGHRTRNTIQQFQMPAAPTTFPDQNLYDNFLAQNTTDAGVTTSAVGGIQTATTTQDQIIFKGLDSSVALNTANDDIVTFKAAVKCITSLIDKDSLVMDGGVCKATINHAFGTNNLIVELWDMHDDPAQARNKVEADVAQEAFNGTVSNNHITVKFSAVPPTDIQVVIHANNNALSTTPQYS